MKKNIFNFNTILLKFNYINKSHSIGTVFAIVINEALNNIRKHTMGSKDGYLISSVKC